LLARKKFNSVTKSTLRVETVGHELYNFQLDKRNKKTCIFGLDYPTFLSHYNMKHGDEIRLDMDTKSAYLTMHPVSKHGYLKERVRGMTINKHICHYCLLICFSMISK
jgi:hypothetical protein